MKTRTLILVASLALSACAHDYHNPSVEASNGIYRDATGVVHPTSAAGGPTGETIPGERARKAEAWNKLPQ